jgi:hypothetical protein
MSLDVSPEVVKLHNWLVTHGFNRLDTGEHELWARSDCDVRLVRRRQALRVEVRRRLATGWLDLDECVALHGGLSTTATVPPIELATSPPLPGQANRFWGGGFRRAPGKWLYRRSKRWAYGVKVALQMAVGAGAVADLGWHIAYAVQHRQNGASFTPVAEGSVAIIAGALAVAAGVELAYTLYTPGPDEALDPLMLGLSSAILLLITRDNIGSVTSQFLAALLGVLALGALFLIRRHLLDEGGIE